MGRRSWPCPARSIATCKAAAQAFLPLWYFKLISCHFLGFSTGKSHPEPWLCSRSRGRVSEACVHPGRTGSLRSWRILLPQDRTGRRCGSLAGAATAWRCHSFKISICFLKNFLLKTGIWVPCRTFRKQKCTDEQIKKKKEHTF